MYIYIYKIHIYVYIYIYIYIYIICSVALVYGGTLAIPFMLNLKFLPMIDQLASSHLKSTLKPLITSIKLFDCISLALVIQIKFSCRVRCLS